VKKSQPVFRLKTDSLTIAARRLWQKLDPKTWKNRVEDEDEDEETDEKRTPDPTRA
jgi:hypothetical protein